MWDGDLASMENVSQHNDAVKFLLDLIDIFSRYVTVCPLKNKKSEMVAKAFKNIFKNHNRKPQSIRFEGEFKSATKIYMIKNTHILYE